MSSDLDLGALSGRVELEDRLTPVLDTSSISVEKFEELFGKMGNTVAREATAFVTAEAVIEGAKEALEAGVDILKELTIEGAGIADVEENFNKLATQAGHLGEELLGSLREGTHNTITDFELMKTVNGDLAAGMNLTDQQFKSLASGGFALAQAKGIDVKEAFDTINDAMLTGRTRALQMLTGKIDLAAAEDKLAASLGTTADRLNEEGKLQAARQAILESVGKATSKLGEQTDGLDEMLAQAHTAWSNWYEDLAKTVATSPNVIHAYEAIRDAVMQAFGGDSQTAMQTVVGWINRAADAVAQYGPVVIQWFGRAKDWVVDFYHTVLDTWNGLPDWLKTVAERTALAQAGLLVLGGAANTVSGGITELIGTAGNLTTTLSGLPAALSNIASAGSGVMTWLGQLKDIRSVGDLGAFISLAGESAVKAIGPFGQLTIATAGLFAAWEVGKLQPVSDFFARVGAWAINMGDLSMAEIEASQASAHAAESIAAAGQAAEDAAKKQQAAAAAAREKAEADRAAAIEAKNHSVIQQAQNLIVQQSQEEMKKLREATEEINSVTTDFHKTVAELDSTMVESIKHYIEAGVSQQTLATYYGLTASQVTAVAKALKEEQDALKLEEKQIADSKERWAEFNATRLEMSGSATDKLIADIDRWKAAQIKSHVDAKTDTADFYNWLGATENQMYEKADRDRLLQDEHSRAHFQQMASDAQEAYDFARQHASEFTDSYIEGLRQTSVAAAQAAQNWESSMGATLTDLTGKVQTLSGEWMTLQEYQAKQSAPVLGEVFPAVTQFTIDSTQGGADTLLDELFSLQRQIPQEEAALSGMSGWSGIAAAANLAHNKARFATLQAAYELLLKNSKSSKYKKMGGPDNQGNTSTTSSSNSSASSLSSVGGFSNMTQDGLTGMPTGAGSGASVGAGIVLNNYINGTAADVARQVSDEVMRQLKSVAKFGSA